MEKRKRPQVEIPVYDYMNKVLPRAKVTMQPLPLRRPTGEITLKFDRKRQAHCGDNIPPGEYLLRTGLQGFEPDQREVRVAPGSLRETFILGKKGMPFYYRGRIKVPFEPPKDLLGVSLKAAVTEKQEKELLEYTRKLKLEPEKVSKAILEENIRIFRFPPRSRDKTKYGIQRELSEHPLVRLAGPVIRIDKESVSFLTNQIVVKFKPHVTREESFRMAKQLGLTVIRSIPYAGNAYLMSTGMLPHYDLLKTCHAVVKTGLCEYAEPNLVVSAIDLQINATDFLYAQQWHIPLINLPDAWQILQNANAPGIQPGDPGDLTFGSEDIIIAIMDRGIQSQTAAGVTSAAHPDFVGTVTGGDDKVYEFFDFANMVADNDNPPNDHGMGCAGVATALANNPSVVAGQEEGVSGAAPNCRAMGLIRPAGGTTQQYADAYIWTAGFDPGWTADGINYPAGTAFPAAISPGTDIISNSFLIPTGGLMEDCFDFLTTFGRGGKGIPIFSAAGNSNINVTANNPMAAYEKSITVAASTNNDVKAPYSAFGNDIDICAPSSDGFGITTCDLLGGGNVAGHTGGGLDYRDDFGGTSSATPLVAGVAALMLSANPDLTWVQVRQILRETAVQIDAANTNPTGQWVDTDGDGVNDFSQWYGFGRVDAQTAVQEAFNLVGINPVNHIDTWIMENAGDLGDVPSLPPYSPDVWVRNLDPAVDNPAQVHIHQSPIRGQDNWVYANVRNRGAVDSHDVYVRISITRWAGTQYIYPDDFIPTAPPSTLPVIPMAPGTYLIGEIHIDTIPAGGFVTVNTRWSADIIPPDSVVIDGVIYSWADSCLLVEVSPHDGPAPTGNHTWDNNNLCQRNISILDPADEDDFAIAFVAGHLTNMADLVNVRVDRKNLPADVHLYFDYVDTGTIKEVMELIGKAPRETQLFETCNLTLLTGTKGEIRCPRTGDTITMELNPNTRITLTCCQTKRAVAQYKLKPVLRDGRTVFALPTVRRNYLPLPRRAGEHQIVALLGKGLRKLGKGEYQIDVFQEDLNGRVQGGVNFMLRKG